MDRFRFVLLLAISFLITFFAPLDYGWNIGAKGRVNGYAIHTTYFLTTNNAPALVHAQALLGMWSNGQCQYNSVYFIGSESLQSGDLVDIDAQELRAIVGGGYDCMSIYYLHQQLVIETFQLQWDGINYLSSFPQVNEITIL